MKTIYKYNLPGVGLNKITIPLFYKVLHVAYQGPNLFVWCEVDDYLGTETRHIQKEFLVCGTGWDIDPDLMLEYVGTVHDATGYVWHVYQVD